MAEMTMIQVLNTALREEIERDENVFIIGEDLREMGSTFGVTTGLYQTWPDRVINTPLAEAGTANMSVGAALYGKRPVFEIMFADFSTLIYDAIVNQASKMRYMSHGKVTCPIVFRGPQGAGGGIGAHHSQTVDSWFMNVPGLKMVTPSTPQDAYGLLKASIRDNNPVLFWEHKALYRVPGEVMTGDDQIVQIGQAKTVKEGSDITIVANQLMLMSILKTLPEIEKESISVELIDPRTIKPFDYKAVETSVKKTGRLLLVSEGCREGNWTAEIASNISESCFESLKSPVRRLGAVDSPIPYAKAELFMIPSMESVIKTVGEMMQ
ncbi:alpha-ketoacid dehydrogenase subunit beta [Pseudoramibacter alactolyticus]|uniref:alpha-ketoacid dehydrogenase subunit beta n=1 Tax=Pseudoramibacter alactolyticus TaxID=113287 RepID=UPI00248E9671|nr:pyruvate dehydrogenase complex E1 component subunit beta [Pseudoramibacter alactolyticus]